MANDYCKYLIWAFHLAVNAHPAVATTSTLCIDNLPLLSFRTQFQMLKSSQCSCQPQALSTGMCIRAEFTSCPTCSSRVNPLPLHPALPPPPPHRRVTAALLCPLSLLRTERTTPWRYVRCPALAWPTRTFPRSSSNDLEKTSSNRKSFVLFLFLVSDVSESGSLLNTCD